MTNNLFSVSSCVVIRFILQFVAYSWNSCKSYLTSYPVFETHALIPPSSLFFSSTPLLPTSLAAWHAFISSVWCSLEKHTGSVTSPPSFLCVAVRGSRARWAAFFHPSLLLFSFFLQDENCLVLFHGWQVMVIQEEHRSGN